MADVEMNPMLQSRNTNDKIDSAANADRFDPRRVAIEQILNEATSKNLNDFDDWLHSISVTTENTDLRMTTTSSMKENHGSIQYELPFDPSVSKAKRAAQFVLNWVQTWNYLIIADDEYFTKTNTLFTACCSFYFHFKIMRVMIFLTVYVMLLYILTIALDIGNWSVYIGPVITNALLLGAYIWGATIYKGKVLYSTLEGESTRIAREKITLINNKLGTNAAQVIDVGSQVLVKSYQDGEWIPGVVVKMNVDHGLNRTSGNLVKGSFSNNPNANVTYDVKYDNEDTIETMVTIKYLRLRDRNIKNRTELLLSLISEILKVIRTAVKTLYHNMFGQMRSKKTGFWGLCCDNDGGITWPTATANAAASASSRIDVPPGKVTESMNTDALLQKEVLKFYAENPMTCGYWELLEWAMKYVKLCGNTEQFKTSLNHSITTALTVMVIVSPIVFMAIYISLYYTRTSFQAPNDDNPKSYFLQNNCQPGRYCKANYWFFILSGAYSVLWVQQVS